MYFYELHETDDELFSDVLLAHDAEYDENEFLELVLEARAAVVDRFEDDSLIEAVARELARIHGFQVIDDSQLRVAVNVSIDEGETAVAAVDERAPRADVDQDRDGDAYRSLLIEADPEDSP